MLAKRTVLMGVLVVLLSAGRLWAGGPPLVCVPIDGATAENAKACGDLIAAKLTDQILPGDAEHAAVKLREIGGQWYASFYMSKDVRLSEIEASLEGSEFSIPRDRMHLFGHTVVEFQPQGAAKELATDVGALEFAFVEEAKPEHDALALTVAMPYVNDVRRDEFTAWNTFRWWREVGDPSLASEPNDPTAIEQLPSMEALAKAAASHGAKLKDVRWSTEFACRSVGAVAVESKGDAVAAR